MWMDVPVDPPAEVVQHECAVLADRHLVRRDDVPAQDTKKDGGTAFSGLRADAIRQEALSVGAQHGLKWRYERINALLEHPEIASALDRIYNFQALQTHWQVLPPVISEGREAFNKAEDGQSARMAMRTWEILQPARIVSAPPNWRSYLVFTMSDPRLPSFALMPASDSDERIWRSGLCEGWRMGARQADRIFQDNLNRLVRDYTGMLRFRVLAAQGIVTMPVLEEGRLGITVNGERMHVDDRVYQITAPVTWQKASNWRAVTTLEPTP